MQNGAYTINSETLFEINTHTHTHIHTYKTHIHCTLLVYKRNSQMPMSTHHNICLALIWHIALTNKPTHTNAAHTSTQGP